MALFVRRKGATGYGVYWTILEVLDYQNDHRITMRGPEIEGIAVDLNLTVEELMTIVRYAIDPCELLETDGLEFWQARMLNEKRVADAAVEELSLVRSEAGKKGAAATNAANRNRQNSASAESDPAKSGKGRQLPLDENRSDQNRSDQRSSLRESIYDPETSPLSQKNSISEKSTKWLQFTDGGYRETLQTLFRGDEHAFRKEIARASDHLTLTKRSFEGEAACAYMRKWMDKAAEFAAASRGNKSSKPRHVEAARAVVENALKQELGNETD